MTLPQETIDKLIADKTQEMLNFDGSYSDSYIEGYQDGIKAGATEWAGKASGLVDALEWIKTYGPCDALTVKFIDNALAKYKEVENGK